MSTCPEDNQLMDHSLGRSTPGELRLHLAHCRRCQDRLHKLEEGLLSEGVEFKGQASYPFQSRRQAGQRDAV
ncbi:MAG: hypothetical protein K1X75_01295 [Leptospirales bacterium]|nr:hypothetical protein [Leptospirales bacterium]